MNPCGAVTNPTLSLRMVSPPVRSMQLELVTGMGMQPLPEKMQMVTVGVTSGS